MRSPGLWFIFPSSGLYLELEKTRGWVLETVKFNYEILILENHFTAFNSIEEYIRATQWT